MTRQQAEEKGLCERCVSGQLLLYTENGEMIYAPQGGCPLFLTQWPFFEFMCQQYVAATKPMSEGAFEGWAYEEPQWFIDALTIIARSNEEHNRELDAQKKQAKEFFNVPPKGVNLGQKING